MNPYKLLSRLQSDCDYFLGAGKRSVKYLYAKDAQNQIEEMKKLYNSLKVKPEWLTWEDILDYEAKMIPTVSSL